MATLLSPPSPFPNPPKPHAPLPHCSGDSQTPATAILHLSFNQDSTCFAAATDAGFRVHDCVSFRQILRRDLPSAAAAAEMLFRTTAFALVGGDGGSNKVQIWEDRHARSIASLSFRSEVRSVRLHRERVVVAVLNKVFVYNFSDLRLVHQVETIANPSGLCAVSHVPGRMVLACPGLRKGCVRVEHYGLKKTRFVVAHDSMVASLALSQDGTLLATASTKGTLVRVFSTLDGSLLQELRRGADRAEIYSLAFSSAAQRLAVSSSKGTVHIFNLNVECRSSQDDKQQTSKPNPSTQSAISSLPFIRGALPRYFSSECSVAKYRLQEGVRSIVAFGHQKNTVVIVGMDGSFRRCLFDPESGGDMTELEHYNFLRPEETS